MNSKALGVSALILLLSVAEAQPKAVTNVSSVEDITDSSSNIRLPNETLPIFYEIHITTRVHEGKEEFQGITNITIKVVEDTQSITVHSKNLTIESATIKDRANNEVDCAFVEDTDRDFLVITPKNGKLLKEKEEFILSIKYNGTLRKNGTGLYVTSYKAMNGEIRLLASTHFESTNARYAFPCYDEPAKEAIFKFSITHGKNYTAISNTSPFGDPIPVPDFPDLVTTAFKPTKEMSTYTTGFVVSDFVYTEAEYRGFKQRFYSRPETKALHESDLTLSLQMFKAVNDYFGINHRNFTEAAGDKFDLVAIPEIAFDANVNWGLPILKENFLLIEENETKITRKTNAAIIFAYEAIQQCIGNYVSIEWWSYLWLKEGIAVYFSYVVNDIVNPSWDVFQSFMITEYQQAMIQDITEDSLPMTHYVQKPEKIKELYDSKFNSKSAAVIRMWVHALSKDVFHAGLIKFFEGRAYKSVGEQDLFADIEWATQARNFPIPASIDEMMGSWTRQGGHPLLIVKRNYDDGSFTITQEQYIHDSAVHDNNKTFYVPFNYAQGSSCDFNSTLATHFMYEKEQTVKDAKLKNDEFLILNKKSTGFYNIQYDIDNYKLIAKALRQDHLKIPVQNRISIIHDAYLLTLSSRLKYDILFELLSYLENEKEYGPWDSAVDILGLLNSNFEGHETVTMYFNLFIHQITRKAFKNFGISDTPEDRHFDPNLRQDIVKIACGTGLKECLEAASIKLKDFVANKTSIDAEIKSEIVCSGLKEADKATFDEVYEFVLSSEREDRKTLFTQLSCIKRKHNIDKYLDSYFLEPRYTNDERELILFNLFARGRAGLEASIDFLSRRYREYYEHDSNQLKMALQYMPYFIYSKDLQDSYKDLIKKIKDDPTINLKKNFEKNADAVIENNMMQNEDKNEVLLSLKDYAANITKAHTL